MLYRIIVVSSCAPHFNGRIVQEVQLSSECYRIKQVCRRCSRCVPSAYEIVYDRLALSELPRESRINICAIIKRRKNPARRIDAGKPDSILTGLNEHEPIIKPCNRRDSNQVIHEIIGIIYFREVTVSRGSLSVRESRIILCLVQRSDRGCF